MRFGHFFVDRPIFATVVSLVIVLVGILAYIQLPVSQYPEIAPPTIVVRATFPGADADTIAKTVATPIEQEVNGVEDMLYMSSISSADGNMTLTVTFRLGTDLDRAQVLVQNRVSIAMPRLPAAVREQGVSAVKSSPDLMMVIHMLSPDNTYDQLYVTNYARTHVRDRLIRLPGVGDLRVIGERLYAMRIWLDPDRLAAYEMTAADVVEALRNQNVQVAGGMIGAPPGPGSNAFQYTVTAQGRFSDARDFRYVIVKSTDEGRLIQLQDIARIELGAQDYATNSYLNGNPAVGLAVFQQPETNALATAQAVIEQMAEVSKSFPPGLEYRIIYNPTDFIANSINEVYRTLFEAALLVVLVILVFLQSWRTSIIPIIAIPVSLIGTFAVLFALGLTLNLLTLFGLVLAIGIVVDDAIVVVENVQRNIHSGLGPREAAHQTIREVGSAVIAMSLVLIAVFVPTAFIPGITGQFYLQFAVTISVATAISTLNSLTLSPALAAFLLKDRKRSSAPNMFSRAAGSVSNAFNAGFEAMAGGYAVVVRWLVTSSLRLGVVLTIFLGLIAATIILARGTPQAFIPQMDLGYAIVVIKLPDGASLSRTDAVTLKASKLILDTPGVSNAVAFAGFSGATFSTQSDAALLFVVFDPFDERVTEGLPAHVIMAALSSRLQTIREAFTTVVPPPSVRGIGNAGGFKMQVEGTGGETVAGVLAAANDLIAAANQTPGLTGVFTTFSASSPQYFLEIDREKARMLNVPIPNIFEALSINLGTSYINDFNAFGRVYQVRAQADSAFRADQENILRFRVRSSNGTLVPLGALVDIRDATGPTIVQHYDMAVSVPIQGVPATGTSTGEALAAMEAVANAFLPPQMTWQWTEIALQQSQLGNLAIYVFGLAVLFAFLAMAANYESWVLPFAIILIVPLSVFAALIGVNLRSLDNNILTQIGLVALVGLAAKNAILIVEFAKQAEDRGLLLIDATVDACRLRLRPILMTAFAFILGVVPLALATGPGAEMRISLGTAVFFGMLGVTFFGLFLTPVFYVVLRRLTSASAAARGDDTDRPSSPAA